MNPMLFLEESKKLSKQRGFLVCVVVLSLVTNVLLSAANLRKNDRIIVLPGIVSKEFSMQGVNMLSDAYVEQMGIFFTHLLLDLTPQNVGYNASILLKNVDQSNYFTISEYFKKKEKAHKNYNLVTRFDITSLKIIKERCVIEVEGVLNVQFGAERNVTKPAKYMLNYGIQNGKMLVTGFSQDHR